MPYILVVDDEVTFQDILEIVLKRAGHLTRTASDVTSAFAQIQREVPALIILDDQMPGVSGGEFCAHLKADPATRNIPVIMYSAGYRIHNPAFQKQSGADAYIAKTTRPLELVNTITKLIAGTAGAAGVGL